MKAESIRRLVQHLTTFGPCMAGVLIALVLVSLSPPHVGGAPNILGVGHAGEPRLRG